MRKIVSLLLASIAAVSALAITVDQKVYWVGDRMIKKGDIHPGIREISDPIPGRYQQFYAGSHHKPQ